MNKVIQYLFSPFTDVKHKKSTHGITIPVLDGIRGLAVLIVLASHTNAFCMYGQGSIGVLLFFFLSGFVLIIPFYDNPEGVFHPGVLKKYFLNRVFRIVPAYVIIVGATAIIQNTGYEWYLWNISFLKGWNHFWSVAEEVRFYLLLPLIVICMKFIRNKYIQIVIISIIAYFSYVIRNKHQIDMMDGRHVGFYFYMFMGGVLTYLLINIPLLEKVAKNNFLYRIFVILSCVILCSFMLTSTELIAKLWRPLFHNLPDNLALNGWRIPYIWFFLFMILFFTLTFYQRGAANQILECYFLRHIGLLSFSIYLSHMVILIKLHNLGFREEGLFFAVFTISYLVSLISYIFVEKPFLLLKKRVAKRNFS